jgi:hypothetical protein
MLETLEISLVSNIPKRQTNGKLEMIMKQEKFQRAVVDNKLMLLAINAVPGKVLEHIAFHKPEDRHKMQENPTRNEEVDRPSSGSTADAKIGTQKGGIFSRLTIKGEDRSKVLDRIISECSKPVGEDIMIGEIDQTGMELHERCDKAGDGVMGHFLGLLQHVSTVLAPKLQGRLCGKLDAKLVADIKSGMVLVMRVEGTALKIRFPDLYLDSGWLNTSHMNFENELFATLSAHVMNPEALFNKNRKTGRFYIKRALTLGFSPVCHSSSSTKTGIRGNACPHETIRRARFSLENLKRSILGHGSREMTGHSAVPGFSETNMVFNRPSLSKTTKTPVIQRS